MYIQSLFLLYWFLLFTIYCTLYPWYNPEGRFSLSKLCVIYMTNVVVCKMNNIRKKYVRIIVILNHDSIVNDSNLFYIRKEKQCGRKNDGLWYKSDPIENFYVGENKSVMQRICIILVYLSSPTVQNMTYIKIKVCGLM